MPTRPFTMSKVDDSKDELDLAFMAFQCDDDDADILGSVLFLAASEPFLKRQKQDIGTERYSLERLRREVAAQGTALRGT